MNVLITSASRKVSLVRAFQKALSSHGGGKVIAVDASAYAPALQLSDAFEIVPRSHDPGFREHLLALCRRHDIGLLIPTRDEELPFFAAHRQTFREAGTTVMVSAPETIRVCQDKHAFQAFCASNGFPTPRSYEGTANVPDDAFPVFIKPRFGKGSEGISRASSRTQLQSLLTSVPDAIIQAAVTAPEFTIDYFADFEGRPISAVPRERIQILAGESVISCTRRIPRLIDATVELSQRLGLVGHNTVQCFMAPEGPLFIEVNPRFGGACALGFAAGAASPDFLVQLMNGETLSSQLGNFLEDLVMLRYSEDLFLPEQALQAQNR